jgi:hypothetical protein
MAIDKTGSTENIDSYKRVQEPLSPQQKPETTVSGFFIFYFNYCYLFFAITTLF